MGRPANQNYTILAIETSLDDTCAAVTQGDRVLSNVVASQVKFHEEFGGTVPHVAKRKHLEWMDKTVEEALRKAGLKQFPSTPPHPPFSKGGEIEPHLTSPWQGEECPVDAVAVTYGPGLAPSLEVGIAKAKELAKEWNKPLIAVNHMEGHLLSVLAKNSKGEGGLVWEQPSQASGGKGRGRSKNRVVKFPALGFLISGGHTQLVLVKAIGEYELLGETLDDAAGEAYDKVARMLKLGYPGGPILAELAKKGDPKYDLPEPMKHRRDLNFSFSGLKTAAMYKLRDLNRRDSGAEAGMTFSKKFTADFAASFQKAVIQMLMRRFERAMKEYSPKMILLGGGVISNVMIRNEVRKVARKYGVPVHIPYSKKLYTDNAAMIGVAAWYKAKRGDFVEKIDRLDRKPNLRF